MSRYLLSPSKPEYQNCGIVVGWDSALGNFFGEVRRRGEVVIRIAEFRTIFDNLDQELHKVVTAISDYGVIDDTLRARLSADSKKEGMQASKGITSDR